MRYKIKYYSIQSDHILAIPEFDHSEIVQTDNAKKLRRYIELQKDNYGHRYRKASPRKVRTFDFDYISSAGAVIVEPYKSPKVKKI